MSVVRVKTSSERPDRTGQAEGGSEARDSPQHAVRHPSPLGLSRRNALVAGIARALADAPTRERLVEHLALVLGHELGVAGFAIYDVTPQTATKRHDAAPRRAGALRLEVQWGVAVNASSGAARFQALLYDALVALAPRYATFEEAGDDPPAFPSDTPDVVGACGVALLPLVLGDEPLGVLAVRFEVGRTVDEDERELLEGVATQVARSYRTLKHVAELQRRADRLGAMTRAMQQLSHVATEAMLPEAVADAVAGVIPHRECDLLGTTAGGLVRVLLRRDGVTIADPPRLVTDEGQLALETLRTGVSRLAVWTDARDDGEAHVPGGAVGTAEMCAAVRYGRRTAGVVRLTSRHPDAFDLQDLDLLTILARQAGSALETARLLSLQENQRQRAEGAADLARVTLQARNMTDGATELLRVLDRLVPSIGKALGVARGRDGSIEYVATSGTLDVLRDQRAGTSLKTARVDVSGRARELHSIRDIVGAELAPHLPDEWGFLVPLSARERSLGVLVVSSPQAVPLPRRHRVTLERLSNSLALALDALLLDEDERQGREREHLLATALTTIDHPIFILDRVGVRYANPAASREYGWSQGELMDMQFEQLVAGVDPTRGRRVTDGVVETEGISLVQHVHRRRDGTEFPATVTTSALLAQDGDVLGQVVSVRNVTAERQLAEQLRHTEKMIAVGELVAGVAHEINNPLTGVSAFAQLLLEQALSDEQRESVQLIKQESDRAVAVVRDLLTFSRQDEPAIGPVDLKALLEQTLRLRAYPLRHTGIRVERFNDAAVPRVLGNVQKLQQVMINLISNAEYAMSDAPRRILTVRLERRGEHVALSFTDTGRGMVPEVRRRAFEPFFSSKPSGVGTGLGLSVSYGIVQAHGGTIEVQSETGVGTTVVLTLPIQGPAPTPIEPAAQPDRGSSRSRNT